MVRWVLRFLVTGVPVSGVPVSVLWSLALEFREHFCLDVIRMVLSRHHTLDFRDGYCGQIAAEEEEKRQEHTETSEEHQAVVHRWAIVTPGAG